MGTRSAYSLNQQSGRGSVRLMFGLPTIRLVVPSVGLPEDTHRCSSGLLFLKGRYHQMRVFGLPTNRMDAGRYHSVEISEPHEPI